MKKKKKEAEMKDKKAKKMKSDFKTAFMKQVTQKIEEVSPPPKKKKGSALK